MTLSFAIPEDFSCSWFRIGRIGGLNLKLRVVGICVGNGCGSGVQDYPNIATGNGEQGFLNSSVAPIKVHKEKVIKTL